MQFGLAPIILFVYNRPWHTRQTLEALSKNELARDSHLIVYCDGPKMEATQDDLNKIKQVRSVIREKKWCKTIEIVESETNQGLADSIIKGVSEVVNRYGRIIVLEDDIITSPGFLKYMNDALAVYEYEERVMNISAYFPPIKETLPNTFFFNIASCWGWGTWKRAWEKLNTDTNYLINKIERENKISLFNIEDGYDFYSHLLLNKEGEIKTWAIKWYATMFLNQGYSLHTFPSLVNNIGHDGQGVHCAPTTIFYWNQLSLGSAVNKLPIKENSYARMLFRGFYKSNNFHVNKYDSYYKRRLRNIFEKYVPIILQQFYYNFRNAKSIKRLG
jgi:hypothetical protein